MQLLAWLKASQYPLHLKYTAALISSMSLPRAIVLPSFVTLERLSINGLPSRSVRGIVATFLRLRLRFSDPVVNMPTVLTSPEPT